MPLRKWHLARLLLGAAVLLLSVSMLLAQDEEGMRRVTLKGKPPYPELPRRMNVSGIVRLEVAVAPDGEVKESKALGGNPVLIQAAETAVPRWKFEAGTKQTVERITFRFSPE
jgi:TonB family protein